MLHIFHDDYFLSKILPITIIFKIIWIISVIIHFYIDKYYNINNINKILTTITELVYISYNILMSVIILYLFKHKGKICISHDVKEYLFIYGILIIISNIKHLGNIIYTGDIFESFTYIKKYILNNN